MDLSRRRFLSLLPAPLIVSATNIMPIRPLPLADDPLEFYINQQPARVVRSLTYRGSVLITYKLLLAKQIGVARFANGAILSAVIEYGDVNGLDPANPR